MEEALARYTAAKGYYQSAAIILRSPDRSEGGREVITLLALCMLTGFALELYFKAWLLACGRPSKEVRKYGHCLDDLILSATENGLPVQPELSKLVGQLMHGHEDFTYRYLSPTGTVSYPPDWVHAYKVMRWLNAIVDDKVGASAAHGLIPGH
jgi:hypothetical protein